MGVGQQVGRFFTPREALVGMFSPDPRFALFCFVLDIERMFLDFNSIISGV